MPSQEQLGHIAVKPRSLAKSIKAQRQKNARLDAAGWH